VRVRAHLARRAARGAAAPTEGRRRIAARRRPHIEEESCTTRSCVVSLSDVRVPSATSSNSFRTQLSLSGAPHCTTSALSASASQSAVAPNSLVAARAA